MKRVVFDPFASCFAVVTKINRENIGIRQLWRIFSRNIPSVSHSGKKVVENYQTNIVCFILFFFCGINLKLLTKSRIGRGKRPWINFVSY